MMLQIFKMRLTILIKVRYQRYSKLEQCITKNLANLSKRNLPIKSSHDRVNLIRIKNQINIPFSKDLQK